MDSSLKKIASRVSSFALAVAVSMTSIGTDLFSINSNEDVTVSAAYTAGQVYYDSGTMVLNGYYDKASNELANLDEHYETYWQTRDVTSLSDAELTLPGTTNINDDNVYTMMCWCDYLDDDDVVDYQVRGAYWGAEDLDGDGNKGPAETDGGDYGMKYNYIARGEIKANTNDTVKIDWEIRAWRAYDETINGYRTVEDLNLTTQAEIQSEWDSKALFEAAAPVWESGNTNWSDWENHSLSIPSGDPGDEFSITNSWAKITTLPYGYRSDSGKGGMEAVSIFSPKTGNVLEERLYSEESTSHAAGTGMLIYEHECSDYANGQECTHTWTSLTTTDGNVTTYPVYSIRHMLSVLWKDARTGVYNAALNDPNDPTELTSYRLYNMSILQFVDNNDPSSSTANWVYTYDNGAPRKDPINVNFDRAMPNSMLISDAVNTLSFSDIYNLYNAGEADVTSGIKEENVGNGRQAFMYAVELNYDVSDDYQRSGGKISAVLSNPNVTIDTVATDHSTNSHVGNTSGTGINDRVTITMDGETAERRITVESKLYFVNADGSITPTTIPEKETNLTFGIGETEKEITVSFNFTPETYAGKTLIVCQKVYDAVTDTLLASHEDPTDEDQKIYFPSITTSAKDGLTNNSNGKAEAGASIIDTVTYKNLIPGETYVIEGSVVEKTAQGGEGNTVTGLTTNEVVFVPTSANGTATVNFTFDASSYDGDSVVVYERLYHRVGQVDALVTVHEDISDLNQTVTYEAHPIEITTNAINPNTADSQIGDCVERANISDIVHLKNIIDNQAYTITGQLYLVDDNGATPLLVNDRPVKATVTRRAGSTSDHVNVDVTVPFQFDARGLAGKTIVIYETVVETDTGRTVSHNDPTDRDQMIFYPGIDTVAVDKDTGTHRGVADADAIITDTVTLTNLLVGTEYTLEGTLKYVDANNRSGNISITPVKKKFTANTTTQTVTMDIPFDATNYHNNNVVVCEALKTSGESATYVSHADIADADQTVFYQKDAKIITIETDAIDGTSKIQTGVVSGRNTIEDTITYGNADTSITYTAIGELYEITPAGLVVPVLSGNVQVTATTTFRPTAEQGIAKVTFNVDSSLFEGKTLVVYESIYEGTDSNGIIFGDPVATHADPTDTRQMIFYPSLDTVAVDKTSGTHVGDLSETSVITDTITYTNLTAGVKYTMQGSLMTKDASGRVVAVVGADGKPVVITQDFTPTTSTGTLVMSFTIDSTKYEGQDIVVYEQLMVPNTSTVYVAHADMNDADQTVHYKDTEVVIETDALNKITNSPLGKPSTSDSIVDTITYKNLVPGTEYVAIGTLYEVIGNNNVTVVKNGGKAVTNTVTFTPSETDGTVSVTFNFDSTAYAEKTLVVYEQIYLATDVANGVAVGDPVAAHEDPADKRQQVSYSSITTIATDLGTASSTGLLSKDASILDRVYYTGLEVGEPYEVVGVIYNKATKLPISERVVGGRSNHTLDDHGYVSAKVQFIPTTADGYVDVTFKFDSTPYAGKNLVVFEKLYKIDTLGAVEVASHEDIDDYMQTISYPTVDTTAFATDGIGQLAEVGPKVEVSDKVTLKNLVIGETYTIKGYLVNQDGGAKIAKTEAELTFVAEEETCVKYLEYTVNSVNLAGKTLVAVANLYTNDVLVCEHNDLEDYDQMIYFCDVETIASSYTGGKVLDPISDEVVIDEVIYTNLVPGNKYRLEGTIVNKLTEKVIATTRHTFTPVEADGKTRVRFDDVYVKGLNGKKVVIFQTLYDITDDPKGVKVATFADIDDVNETLTVSNPTVTTKLTDTLTGEKTVNADDDISLTDEINYTGLVPGNDYYVVSTLVDKETGKPVKDEAGNIVTVKSSIFTAQEETAKFESFFTFQNMDLAGKTIVAFNELYRVIDGRSYLVVEECDLRNADQTVVFTLDPVLDTVATDVDTGSHTLAFTSSAKINDRVTYKGLKSGDTYEITATVYDKSTNAPVAGIAPVTMKFKADNKKGYVDVVIPVDAKQFSGKTLVVFEKITQNGKDIAAHEDINDLDQTVYVNKTDTVLTAGNRTSKTVASSKRVVLVDVINFEGLTPGKTYQITGHILDRENSIMASDVAENGVTINADSEPELIIDGNEGSKVTNGRKIIATKTISFTPATANGSVAIEFVVNTSKLAGHHLVAFETITDKASGVVVGEHKDIYSASQTVTVKSSTTVYTGDVTCNDENCVYCKHED